MSEVTNAQLAANVADSVEASRELRDAFLAYRQASLQTEKNAEESARRADASANNAKKSETAAGQSAAGAAKSAREARISEERASFILGETDARGREAKNEADRAALSAGLARAAQKDAAAERTRIGELAGKAAESAGAAGEAAEAARADAERAHDLAEDVGEKAHLAGDGALFARLMAERCAAERKYVRAQRQAAEEAAQSIEAASKEALESLEAKALELAGETGFEARLMAKKAAAERKQAQATRIYIEGLKAEIETMLAASGAASIGPAGYALDGATVAPVTIVRAGSKAPEGAALVVEISESDEGGSVAESISYNRQ